MFAEQKYIKYNYCFCAEMSDLLNDKNKNLTVELNIEKIKNNINELQNRFNTMFTNASSVYYITEENMSINSRGVEKDLGFVLYDVSNASDSVDKHYETIERIYDYYKTKDDDYHNGEEEY